MVFATCLPTVMFMNLMKKYDDCENNSHYVLFVMIYDVYLFCLALFI